MSCDKSGNVRDATRPLGATAVMVSRLGLGMAALGRPGYINLGHGEDLGGARGAPSMEANAGRVLDAAWAAGIHYFDAARSYGLGEAFLGRWLEARHPARGRHRWLEVELHLHRRLARRRR